MYKKITNITQHEDNTSIIRVARMVNALTFAAECYRNAENIETEWAAELQRFHATWLMGGYLYEALHLVDDLAATYKLSYSFASMMEFAEEMAKHRKVLQEINLNPAFSMDWGGDVTRQQLARIEPDFAEQAGRESLTGDDPYMSAVHKLDTYWLHDRAVRHTDETELRDFVAHGIPNFVDAFVQAGNKFIRYRSRVTGHGEPKEPFDGDEADIHARTAEMFQAAVAREEALNSYAE